MYVLYLWSVFVLTAAHPQCRDSVPPFSLFDTNVFCDMYANFTCCSSQGHQAQENAYNRVLLILEAEGTDQICASYAKELLCQECSPWASHIFELNAIFPDVCPEYCDYIYQNCNSMVAEIMDIISSKVGHDVPELRTAFAESSQNFCAIATAPNSLYCYPEIINNTDLSTEVIRVTNSEAGCLCLQKLAGKRNNPIRFAQPPHVYDMFFLQQQNGEIHAYSNTAVKLPQPLYLDLKSHGIDMVDAGGHFTEFGLIGFCFDEDYINTGKLYVHYGVEPDPETDPSNCNVKSRISSFLTEEGNPNNIDHSTEKIILEQCRPTLTHASGELICKDGYLFIFFGDGGPQKDRNRNGQNTENLLSSMLRIDPSDPSVPYRVPPGNPNVNNPQIRPEIYSYGFRNPFRVSVDSGDPETGEGCGDIYLGDVGQYTYEEVNIYNIDDGMKNFGWSGKEGSSCHSDGLPSECNNPDMVDPAFEYLHGEMGTCIIGGYVYRGCISPSLTGYYIWADWSSGRLYKMSKNGTGAVTNENITMCGSDLCNNGLINQYQRFIIGFGQDNDGEIYMMTTETSDPLDNSGTVYRFIDPNRSGDRSMCKSRQTNPPTATGCPHLTSPQHGHVKIQICAKRAHYMCFYGYILVGDTERDCIDGVWTGNAPVCNEALCALTLPDPVNGHIVNNQKVATYLCDEGYQVNGKPARFCLDGNWTGSEPTCEIAGSIPANYIKYSDTDCTGNILTSSIEPSLNVCAEQCNNDDLCSAFVFTSPQDCQLWEQCLNHIIAPGTTIYIRDVSLGQK